MYEFEYDPRLDAYLWGTSGDGIGIMCDGEYSLNFFANVVVNGNIYFVNGKPDFDETKDLAVKEYERLKKELE